MDIPCGPFSTMKNDDTTVKYIIPMFNYYFVFICFNLYISVASSGGVSAKLAGAPPGVAGSAAVSSGWSTSSVALAAVLSAIIASLLVVTIVLTVRQVRCLTSTSITRLSPNFVQEIYINHLLPFIEYSQFLPVTIVVDLGVVSHEILCPKLLVT